MSQAFYACSRPWDEARSYTIGFFPYYANVRSVPLHFKTILRVNLFVDLMRRPELMRSLDPLQILWPPTLIDFELVQIMTRICARLTSHEHQWMVKSHQLSSSFDNRMRVDRILVQTLALQLSSSHQLSSSFDQRMRVDRIPVQTLASQRSSTLILVWPAHVSWQNSRANSRF